MAVIQSTGKLQRSSVTGAQTFTNAFAANTTVGNTAIVTIVHNGSGVPNTRITGVTVGGTAGVKDVEKLDSGNINAVEIWRVTNMASASRDVVITLPGASGQYVTAGVEERDDIAASSPLDQTGTGGPTAGSTAPSVTSAGSTTQANEVVYAAFCDYTGTNWTSSTPPAGYTESWEEPSGSTVEAGSAAYQSISSTGTQTATFTTGASMSWITVMATYKQAGGSSAPVGLATETDTALALAPAGPAITSTSTATPAYGAALTISGGGFGASQGTQEVRIGGVVQPISSWAAGSVVVSGVLRGANKYGAAVNVEIWNSGALTSNSFAITGLTPQAGWSYVDIATPNTAVASRIATTPDLASGDQVAYDNVGGLVTVANDATFSAGTSVASFDFEVWSSPEGWGAAATQYIVTTQTTSLGQHAARVVSASRRRGAGLYLLSPSNWGATPLGVEKWFAPELTAAAGGSSSPAGISNETDTALPRGSARPAGVCTEAETAFALAGVQVRAIGLASEADSALARAALQIRAAGLATEADSALAVAGAQLRVTGQAAEADTALTLAAVLSRAVGTAAETDSALALLPGANGAVGLASETDTALPRGSARPAAVALEADTALALAPVAQRAVGLASEADSSFALAPVALRATGLASETDSALALAANVNGAVGLATETDTALPRGAARPVGVAAETDAAIARAPVQIRIAGLAVETDSAFALTPAAGSSVGLASEVDTALPRGSARPVGLATETETALGLAGRLIRSAGLAAEADVALALVAIQRSAAGRADELDSALQLFAPGSLLVGLAIEADTAFALQRAVLPTWGSGGTARIGGTPLPTDSDRIGAGTLGDGGGRIGSSPLSKRTRRIG